MQLLLILAIVAAATTSDSLPNRPVPDGGLRLALALVTVALVTAFPLAAAYATVRALRHDFASRRRSMRRFRQLRTVHTMAWVAATVILLYGLGWAQMVRWNWHLDGLFLADDLLILLPVILPMFVAWEALDKVERAAEAQVLRATPSPTTALRDRGLLGLQVRCHLLLVLLPVLTILAIQDAIRLLWPQMVTARYGAIACLAGLVGLVIGFPWLLRHAWRAESLPAGPLRTALRNDCCQWRIAVSDVLVWPTGGCVTTAAVSGLIPALRYLILSDGLVERFDAQAVQAIAAHEAGHIRHRHLWLRTMALVAPMILLFVATRHGPGQIPFVRDAIALFGGDPRPLAAVAMLVGIGGYAVFVFGPYCRLLEHQADLFACRALHETEGRIVTRHTEMAPAGTARFLTTLERIGVANRLRRHKSSWLHPSTAERAALVTALRANPQRRQRFARKMRYLGLLVTLAFLVGVSCLVAGL
jgi:STE24 endopeptidase